MVSSIPIKYKSFSNISIWSIYGTLTGTTTPVQSGHSNEWVLHTPLDLQNRSHTIRCCLMSYATYFFSLWKAGKVLSVKETSYFELIPQSYQNYKFFLQNSLVHASYFFKNFLSPFFFTHQESFCGGARGVRVIVAGIGHGDSSSNPGRDWLHFT